MDFWTSDLARPEATIATNMYIEGRPVSTYQPTPGWAMPTNAGTGHFKRPPIGTTTTSTSSLGPDVRKPPVRPPPPTTKSSSSSSLSGLEQNIPPFQDFIKQTPPLRTPNKPLPPTPSTHDSSQTSLQNSTRRSSSVYSRTPSQWAPESESSWRTEDLEDHPLPILRPIAYSVSTPDLKSKVAESSTLTPRRFSPLIASPTLSIVTTPASPPQSRPATTLLSPNTAQAPKKPKVQMLSLAQAKEAMSVPGAALLPEELRAQALTKVKSQGHLRIGSSEIFATPSKVTREPANIIISSTLVDSEGRYRMIKTPPSSTAQAPEYPFPTAVVESSIDASPLAKYTAQGQQGDEGRGRTQERGRQSPGMESFKFPPEQGRSMHIASTSRTQSLRDVSASSAYDSDDSIRAHMKMVPQPLFSGKLHPRDSADPRGSTASGSIDHRRSISTGSVASSGQGSTRFPLSLSLSPPQSRHTSGGSNFGHIPISPPSAQPTEQRKLTPANTGPQVPRPKKSHRREKSQSQFYPHIMRRARKSSKRASKKSKKESDSEPPLPGKPLLAADIVANRLKTPATSPMTGSPVTPTAAIHKPTPSDGSETGKRPLFQRMAQGVTNLGRRRSSNTTDRDPSPSSKASPASPHLYPTSSNPRPHPPHLGWSEISKLSYDEAMTPPQTPRSNSKVAALSAKALDERLASVDLPDSPLSPRKPSMNLLGAAAHQMGNFLETLHEGKAQSKAEKQREALKKSIRVVPNLGDGRASQDGGVKGSSSVGRPSGESTRRPSLLSQQGNWL